MAAVKTEIEEIQNAEDILDSGNELEGVEENNVEVTKKKKKRKKKKTTGKVILFILTCGIWVFGFLANNVKEVPEQIEENAENAAENEVENEDAEGDKKKKKRNRKKGGGKTQELTAPQIPIVDQFPDGVFPIGEIQQYVAGKDDRTAKDRFTNEEKRALDRMHNDIYNEVRLAAEAHRQVCIVQTSRVSFYRFFFLILTINRSLLLVSSFMFNLQ